MNIEEPMSKLVGDVTRIKNADARMLVVMSISSEILDIFYHQDKLTTSDLQGAIEAQVMKAYDEGKNAR